MKTWMPLALVCAMALPTLADEPTPESLFHEGWYKETGLKDLEGAIASYEQAVARAKEGEAYAARAQYQIGICCEKMGKAAEARSAFQKVVELYPEQKEWADKAKEKLAGEVEEPKDPSEQVIAKVKATKVSLNFTDAPLADVLAFYREFTQINIILDAAVPKPEEMMVTMRVDAIPFDQALDLTLKMLNLDWCVDEGVVIVSTKEAVAKRVEARKKPAESDADAAAWKAEMQKVLENTKVDLDFTDASIEDIICFIREYSKINIEIDMELRKEGVTERRMTLQLRDVAMKTALKLILDQHGLTVDYVNHVLLIKRDEKPH